MKKIITVIILNIVVLIGGISYAYYNTKLVGFDEDVSVINVDKGILRILDYEIRYDNFNRNQYFSNIEKYNELYYNVINNYNILYKNNIQ